MITTSEIRKVFAAKLTATDNFDEAFVKAVWVAYQHGYRDALTLSDTPTGVQLDLYNTTGEPA